MEDRLAREFWNRVDMELGTETLKDLCHRAGLNYNSVRNRKSGKVYCLPRLGTGYAIAQALGVTLEYLLTGKTGKSPDPRINAIASYLEEHPDKMDAIEVLLFEKNAGQSSKYS